MCGLSWAQAYGHPYTVLLSELMKKKHPSPIHNGHRVLSLPCGYLAWHVLATCNSPSRIQGMFVCSPASRIVRLYNLLPRGLQSKQLLTQGNMDPVTTQCFFPGEWAV
jgi:hypothetical protein